MHPTNKIICIALAMVMIVGTMHGVNAASIDIPEGVKPPSQDETGGTGIV